MGWLIVLAATACSLFHRTFWSRIGFGRWRQVQMCCVALVHQVESSRLATVLLICVCALCLMLLKWSALGMCRPDVLCSFMCVWLCTREELWHPDTKYLSIRGCVAYSDPKFGHDFVTSVRFALIDSWRACVHHCVIKREMTTLCSHL